MTRILTLITVIVFLALPACSSTTPTQATPSAAEIKNTKIQTAKINAQLGIAYLERHDVQRARQKLLMAMDEAPNIPETWYSMAYLLEATGDTDKANEYYKKAIQIAPDRGDAQNNYGTFLCRNKHYQDAVNHFLIAANNIRYLDAADAYENAGLCALKIPDQSRAYTYFERAVMQNPSRPVSLFKLAELNYKKGRYQLAKINLDKFEEIATPTKQSLELRTQLEQKGAYNGTV
jgi:type IV pilus assembly protein PilF